jgi:hypothetical protein
MIILIGLFLFLAEGIELTERTDLTEVANDYLNRGSFGDLDWID